MSLSEADIRAKLIDPALHACGWTIQDRANINLYAGRGVAVRELPVEGGFADYLLFVDCRAAGVIEAKKVGTTLSGVAEQAGLYAVGLPRNIPHVSIDKLPFVYESTGVETYFRDERDPELSVVGEVESAVEVGLVRAARLRQSLLRSAFEGRLV
jgi:type I restriction enzyme R subunit